MFNLEEMKAVLEGPICPDHHRKAKVALKGRGLVISTCCKKFDLMMDINHEKEIARQAEQKMLNR